MRPVFIGSGVAIITPFHKDGKINFERFEKLTEYQINNKTDAIIVCGTTGEGSTLTVYERLRLFSAAVNIADGRVPVIGATGSNSTSFSLEIIKEAEKTGIDAHLMITPYYNKTSQTGLIKHFFTLADNAEKPIIIYNVPSRTGMNITPETYRKLSEHENIVGVKEADPDIAKLIKSIALCEGKLDFYVGNDDLICPAVAVGCKGVISVLSNVMPEFTHELTMAGIKGRYDECLKMQQKVCALTQALFSDVNPIPVKALMKHLGLDEGVLRLPLCETDSKTRELLITSYKKAHI